MPRRRYGALVALALAPASANAVTPSVAVRSVTAGCQPRGAFAVPASAPPAVPAGLHAYVVATGDATPCAGLPVTTTATAGAVRLRWEATPDATDYRVYRDGATVATGVACCDYTDTSPTTTAGAPPAVAAESARAGSSPDLSVTEDFAYDDASDTLATEILRLPAGLFLPGPVTGTALAVIDGEAVPGDLAPTDDPARLRLTLRPEGADPIVLTTAIGRRADGGVDLSTDFGGLRLDRLMRTFDGAGVEFPTSCAAKSVLVDADGAHASAPLQATDCGALAFGPAATLAFDGTTLTAGITQPAGQAAGRAITVTLPEGFSAAGPGQATGSSPLAPVPALPFTTSTTAGGRSVLTLDDLPEAPMADVRLQAPVTRANCADDTVADTTYVGHNGAIVTSRTPLVVPGPAPCPTPTPAPDDPPPQLPARPGIAVTARLGRAGRPRLTLTVRAGNAVAGSNLRRCRVVIPRGLRLSRRTARRRLAVTVDARRTARVVVHPHRLTVRASAAARIVTVTARRGALTAGRRARHRLAFRFAVLTQSGRTYRIVKRVTPRS